MSAQVEWRGVEQAARDAEAEGGTVGVSMIAPNGERFGYRGERRFVAASTIKIPIMVTIYRQIDAGLHTLGETVPVRAEDKTPGSGVLGHLHDGLLLTLEDLIYLMISISDNTATNLLIGMATMARVNETIASLGMVDSVLGRPMRGRLAREGEQENWGTPADFTAALAAILNGRAASAAACEQMIAMLETQQNPRRIARYLPRQEGVRWGSKTGSNTGVVNDAGFILVGGQRLIISVLTEGLAGEHAGELAIGAVSREAMRATRIIEPRAEA